MTVILGAIFGILKAFVSQFMQYLVIKENNRLKLEIAKMELQKEELKSKTLLSKSAMEAGVDELQAGYEHDIAISKGGGFVNGLKALFRPLLTLAIMAMFIVFFTDMFYLAITKYGLEMAVKVVSLELFTFVVTSVISYWFANRGFEKFMNEETIQDFQAPSTSASVSRKVADKSKVDYSKKPVKKYNFTARKRK